MKNKTKSRIPHTRTRSRLGTPEYLAAHSFKDKRSYVTAFGRKVLRGKDMTDLRMKVFRRSGGHCEEVKNGNPHGKYADRKSTRLNSSHIPLSRMPSSA